MGIHSLLTLGEKNIYANPSHTVAIHGLNETESNKTLSFLYDHVAKVEFLYNHVWKDDDFVMWDNRGKLHIIISLSYTVCIISHSHI